MKSVVHQVMDMLPPDTTIQDIHKFLTTVLDEKMILRRKAHVLKGLLLAEHLQV